MYEKEIFTIGIWLGYVITIFVMLLVYVFMLEYKMNRQIRFLRETKQLQKFDDWDKKNKFKLKFIKNDS